MAEFVKNDVVKSKVTGQTYIVYDSCLDGGTWTWPADRFFKIGRVVLDPVPIKVELVTEYHRRVLDARDGSLISQTTSTITKYER